MNEEIKEILERIKKHYVLDETQDELLLDYITNLQQENERLKELCDKYEEEHSTAFKLWTMKMEEMPTYEEKLKIQKENDRANQYIDFYKDLTEKQNKSLEDYKSRCEKAVELLNKTLNPDCDYSEKHCIVLETIDILQGSDK